MAVEGISLFKDKVEISFYAQQRVSDVTEDTLFRISPCLHLQNTCAFIGINASGKTSVLKLISLALGILNNESINHIESRSILGCEGRVVFDLCFLDMESNVCRLRTTIAAEEEKSGVRHYRIVDEVFWMKPLASVRIKKLLTDFSSLDPVSSRDGSEPYLPDDVSFIIAHNRKQNDHIDIFSLMSLTNINILPSSADISPEVVEFLDPTIEKLYFERKDGKSFIHLKFHEHEEIILNSPVELEQYLSSGTIKGIVAFAMAEETLKSGGYLLIDEIENHFNKEIVMTLLRFFKDGSVNRKGGTLIFTSHYPEILDEYDRNDGINIVRNRNGITVQNLSSILRRNDIKKSDAYQSGLLEGTTPSYEAYIRLKRRIISSI